MSLSLRDQRVDLLTYAGTQTNGRISAAYTLGSTVWGRLEQPSGSKTYLNGKEEQRIDAVLAVGDDAVVDPKGLVRVGTAVFKILAVLPGRRRLRESHVLLAQADAQQYPGLP